MTTYYVGPGGSDSNDGLTWVERKLTLNGAEDIPVAANDTVYVGPGIYREELLLDVSGSAGNPITYIGDVTGANTDGVGGEVVITGSDNDVTQVRTYGIYPVADANYRTFRGFHIQKANRSFYVRVNSFSMTNLIIEDCLLLGSFSLYTPSNSAANIPTGLIVRRCMLSHFLMESTVDRNTVDALIENCIILSLIPSTNSSTIEMQGYYNVTFRNCYIARSSTRSVLIGMGSGSNKVYFYNCIFRTMYLQSLVLGALVEDYNVYSQRGTTLYTQVTPGANTVARLILHERPIIMPNGIILPYDEFTPSSESNIPLRGCSSDSANDDIFGITRPATLSKRTPGPIQYNRLERETTTVYGSLTESFAMRDAMATQFVVPISGAGNLKFSAAVYREADYAGTLPQIRIKQYGQSDIVLTDTGSSGQWNIFSSSISPASLPRFIAIEIRSNNTATSGSYKVFWAGLEVR